MVLVSRDGFDVHQTQVGHSWQNNFPRDLVRGVAFYFWLEVCSIPQKFSAAYDLFSSCFITAQGGLYICCLQWSLNAVT